MNIYYKTAKDGETGKKFAELKKRSDMCIDASANFLEKYGFKQYRPSRIAYSGGISSCCTPEITPDAKSWKKDKRGEYMPRLNTKEGISIQREIKALPIVDIDDLNNIVGYKGNGLKSSHIGFSTKNQNYWGFILDDKWGVSVPIDCIEITGTEYNELFN